MNLRSLKNWLIRKASRVMGLLSQLYTTCQAVGKLTIPQLGEEMCCLLAQRDIKHLYVELQVYHYSKTHLLKVKIFSIWDDDWISAVELFKIERIEWSNTDLLMTRSYVMPIYWKFVSVDIEIKRFPSNVKEMQWGLPRLLPS